MSKLPRDTDGTFPSWAWPGGYPIIYITDDGATLCPACANGKNGSLASENANEVHGYRCGWQIEGYDVFYEGPPEICAHCGIEIESAYGDHDATE